MIMKKQILLLLMMILPMVASADAVEINGIYYILVPKAKHAEVTSNPNNYQGAVTIPESVTYDGVEFLEIHQNHRRQEGDCCISLFRQSS